ncbi:hypothetical protein [Burkholderia vietnamiensis]|uniref:hypothetical protein n=1 Tax=Burkholderia vietnamiensis TaxID=60552 RepID=UPI002010D88B|nr:hypothetical protein [Burkholderia vietnamiensis]
MHLVARGRVLDLDEIGRFRDQFAQRRLAFGSAKRDGSALDDGQFSGGGHAGLW